MENRAEKLKKTFIEEKRDKLIDELQINGIRDSLGMRCPEEKGEE